VNANSNRLRQRLFWTRLAPAAAPKAAEKPAEEEVDALDGGMDMFGGGGAKTGDY
jgi:hypothetical protein